jgi:hypothetical protein
MKEDGTNTMYYAIEVAVENRIKEAKADDLHKVARFLKRELTVAQTKALASILGILK